MESLLRWGIENATTDGSSPGPPPEPRKDLDPNIIDAILGKPDAVLMKEALAIGMDSSLDVESRVIALDDLEMLVEQIDNATNLTSLQMYPPIMSLLSSKSPDPVRMQALWILGTAVQNNPKAQADFLTHDPLPTILSIISPSTSTGLETEDPPSSQTRSKAAYALSASLKHNAAALIHFGDVGGWNVIRDALQGWYLIFIRCYSDITIRRKIAFLINTLLLPTAPPDSSSAAPNIPPPGPTIHSAPQSSATPSTAVAPHSESASSALPPGLDPTSTSPLAREALRTHDIIPVLIDSLTAPLPYGPDADEEVDVDYAEKAARALITFIEAVGGELSSPGKSQLNATMQEGGSPTRITWGLSDDEWQALMRNVSGT
ncbi:armadillo-type protein [Gautieria morchelliformis]|nr:armadillo-type protein [Gautieria morchelliformis]